jgi:NADPH:quinone reductase-like Zn-dependent oxidoreductase
VITGGEGGGRWLGGIERNLWAQLLSPFVGQKLGAFVARQRRDDLVVVSEMIRSGAITPPVDRTFPLGEAAAAISYMADGHVRGKVVITM